MANILISSELSTPLNGELPSEIMYFPAGHHTLNPSVDGLAKQVSVTVSQKTANLLQSQLDKLLTENVRPFIDFDHQGKTAAAIPKRFVWKDEGVMLELDWTGSGKTAVSGRDYSYFSPTFLLNEAGIPAGLPKSGAIGALTNNPAFRQIKRIAAHAPIGMIATVEGGYGVDGQLILWEKDFSLTDAVSAELGETKMTEEEATAPRAELATVQADNKKLKDTIEAKKTDTEVQILKAKIKELEEERERGKVEAANAIADSVIEAAIKEGKIAPKNEEAKATWKKILLNDVEAGRLILASLAPNPAFQKVVTVSGSHRDIGKPAPVADTTLSGSNNGKLCKAAVREYQATHPNVSFEDAWRIQADLKPELFSEAN